jgi:hypothetical protein
MRAGLAGHLGHGPSLGGKESRAGNTIWADSFFLRKNEDFLIPEISDVNQL